MLNSSFINILISFSCDTQSTWLIIIGVAQAEKY